MWYEWQTPSSCEAFLHDIKCFWTTKERLHNFSSSKMPHIHLEPGDHLYREAPN